MTESDQKLEEVPIYCRSDDFDRTLFLLDPKIPEPRIVNLIRALQSINIETIGSCEGHLDHGHQHPWVSFDHYRFTSENVSKLRCLLEVYNESSKIEWRIIDGDWILPQTYRELCISCRGSRSLHGVHRSPGEVMDLERLSELQQDVEKLAHYLFKNNIDEMLQD